MKLTDNSNGYSVLIDNEITNFFSAQVLAHLSRTFDVDFNNFEEVFVKTKSIRKFDLIKSKQSRIFDKKQTIVVENFIRSSTIGAQLGRGFEISDEEKLGYSNIYFRVVRSNEESDVGGLHADKWFWDLNNQHIPDNLERIKIWLPLLQDNKNPSLLIIPGSHLFPKYFSYNFVEDSHGKKRPTIRNNMGLMAALPAPVKVGEYIVFHDQLIHGGRATQSDRISVEFTVLIKKHGY